MIHPQSKLFPASAAGLAAVYLVLRGIGSAPAKIPLYSPLLPGRYLLIGGIAAYLLLFVITLLLLRRPVTSELFLIIGWAILALAEINVFYGTGRFLDHTAAIFIAVIAAAAIISLICYVLYYRLDSRAGYLDGMVPLLLAAVVTGAIAVRMMTAA